MLVWDGRVTTLWACASGKTRPAAANRSSVGVETSRLPANPRASARRVSTVISTRSAPRRASTLPAPAADGGGGRRRPRRRPAPPRRPRSPPGPALRSGPACSSAAGRPPPGGQPRRASQALQVVLRFFGELVFRVDLDQLLEIRLGLGGLALVEVDQAAVVVGLGQLRVLGDHPGELVGRLVNLLFVVMLDPDAAQRIRVHLGALRQARPVGFRLRPPALA